MNILTFDIEDWFHILDEETTKTEKEWNNYESRLKLNMEKIFELLQSNNQRATFFCLGWIAKKYPDIIKQIDSMGYEVASHSYMHQLIYEQTKDELKEDIVSSIKVLEDIIGKKVVTYRAPGFSIKKDTVWAFEILIENGIEIDASVFPAKRGHGGFEDFGTAEPILLDVNGKRLKEFPINLINLLGKKIIFSGGGYFRFFPYWYLQSAMKRSNYVMTYFHPRDFDPNQPMISNLSLVRKFKSYYGLKGAYAKLQSLIADYPFVDLKQAVSEVNWEKAKVIKI